MSLDHELQAVLHRTETYEETLSLRPIQALRAQAELVIASRLSTARDPSAPQVRYRTLLDSTTARGLAATLSSLADLLEAA